MKLRVHENSLFAVLWRSPWWVSGAIAAALFAAAKMLVPEPYAGYVFFVALPFAVIALVAAWKQLRQPSAGRVAENLEALRAMNWDDFSAAVEEAFRRDGYAVTRLAGAGADFELAKAGRVTLVGAKRWKAARTGVEPLRDLYAAAHSREAEECIYVAAGEVSDTARTFAADKNIRLVHAAELAKLLPLARRLAKKAP
jgi:restriction system protein